MGVLYWILFAFILQLLLVYGFIVIGTLEDCTNCVSFVETLFTPVET